MLGPNLKELQGYLLQHLRMLFVVSIALISVTMALLSIGYIFRELIDQGISSNQRIIINESIFTICGLIAVFAVGSFFRSYFINLIALKVSSKLRYDTFQNLLRINVTAFEEIKIGDIISRLSSDIELVNGLIINFLSFFVRNSIMLVGAIIFMFIQSPKLSILTLICIPILLLPILKISKIVRKLSRQFLEKQGEFAANIDEIFVGIRTVHAYNQQRHQTQLFQDRTLDFNNLAANRLKTRSLFFALAISLISIALIMVVWIGSLDIIDGSMSSGKMMSFIYYAFMVGLSAGGIAEMFSEIQGPISALDRILELKNTSTNYDADINNEETSLAGDIVYSNIFFSYPSRPKITVLNNLSLKIKHGDFTAIVGKSGSGKSTLLQLLLKFYHHNTGEILINSQEISHISDHYLRSKISYVDQAPVIFSGSIRENILFSNPAAKEEDIQEIIKMCDIDSFANALPQGIDTEIGQRGVRLSGGQKQRIAIARALIYNPEILLLDEATSALDSESEKAILDNINLFMRDKTVISIAHRVSSIEKADDILVLNEGKVAEQGKHNELIKKSVIYKNLYSEHIQN
ncbi:MAG: hypothetical protein DGJ47_001047 [Rickettsiaceae bacterium]